MLYDCYHDSEDKSDQQTRSDLFHIRHYWHSHGSLVQQTVLRDKCCSSGYSWHRNIRNKLLAPQAEMDLKRLSEVSRHKTLGADGFLLKKELDKKQVVLVITIKAHSHTILIKTISS